ncbi:FG-GAP repeat domain-containing protein [Mucilaginibacter terrenus]|nr:VCBS repeat-containing protein [Mucilaginibacter terrenus]
MGIVAVVTAAIFVLNGCDNQPHVNTPAEDITAGKQLSQKYCGNCHRYPDPQLLDKSTWERGIMPQMAKQLGIQSEMGGYYADEHSALSMADWQRIMAYYQKAAPAKLIMPARDAVTDWANFKLKLSPVINRKGATAMTTMVKLNPYDGFIYTGDAGNNLLKWDAGLNAKLVKKMPSPVSDVIFNRLPNGGNTGVFSCLGVLPPNDYLKGSLESIDLRTSKPVMKTFMDSLPRPVFTASADFNKDGLQDYIVCGYGNTRGALFLLQQKGNNTYEKKVIRAVPGAIQAEIGDYNNDGWPDVMCLFAQADEGVWMFLNNKKGGFVTQNLLRFPPVYGTNSFQLVDMNKDGLKDIVYTCGDNNDYSSILKPYHGVYVFSNLGNWKFKQSYFHHINGASKVMSADFDGDCDRDMAVIAFFPDFVNHPQEGFTYLEQTATWKFKAHEIPINRYGRWIAMEVADIDHDGDQDIVLGNFSIYADRLINQKNFKPNWDIYRPLVVLENKGKKVN